MKSILATILPLLLSISIFAQEKINPLDTDRELTKVQRKMLSRQYIEALKDGVLIIRLKTQDKALKKLEGILKSSSSEAQKQRIRDKDIPRIKADRDDLNNTLRQAFDKKFKLASVYFMPDTCTSTILQGRVPDCLTDVAGKAVSGKLLQGKTFTVVDYGQLSNDRNAQITGIMASDNKFDLLPSPFPYFQKNGGFFTQLSNKKLTLKNAAKMVEKWEKRLRAYYNTAQSK